MNKNKERLISRINEISNIYKFAKQSSIKHGFRFIDKLDKYNLLRDYTQIEILDDGNLSIRWSYTKPKKATFTIDFDEDNDKLVWCCEVEGVDDIFYGSVCHLEDILKYLQKYLGAEKHD